MITIDITPLEEKYIKDGWDKLMSYESYLSILQQREVYTSNAVGYETFF